LLNKYVIDQEKVILNAVMNQYRNSIATYSQFVANSIKFKCSVIPSLKSKLHRKHYDI